MIDFADLINKIEMNTIRIGNTDWTYSGVENFTVVYTYANFKRCFALHDFYRNNWARIKKTKYAQAVMSEIIGLS